MNAKQQEADRVRMEQQLLAGVRDVEQALADAQRVAPYHERLGAWSLVEYKAGKAYKALREYVEEYGLGVND